MYVYKRERTGEESARECAHYGMNACVYVQARQSERGREGGRDREREKSMRLCVCGARVCVCVRVRVCTCGVRVCVCVCVCVYTCAERDGV